MLRHRDDENGGRDGVVLNMTMSGDGIWNAVYSVQVFLGDGQQPLSLSVDTGSSDIWLASNSCSTSECSDAHTSLYDPSNANQTGQSVDLTYLRGAVSGPVVWDTFKLGPYTIPFQALAAADQVTDEPLSSDFVGLLGLALPPNSKIAQLIPPTESDAADGATMQQNLFGLTPVQTAPQQRFFGISLERPGSSRIPSLLTIGRHPSNLVPGFDPFDISFADLIASKAGDTFWRVRVDSITGWVDSVPKPVALGSSAAVADLAGPVAIVDTGGSAILTTRDIANGIYGAFQIGPGADGNYYVPCTTPVNISIGLGRLPPIPLHPLDITAPAPVSMSSTPSDSSTCLGLIQASDDLAPTTDIVLGVPFLRNVYTVLSSSSSGNASSSSPQGSNLPRLGLLPLTDPATALSEFHTVRVLGQPLDPSASPPARNAGSSVTVGKKLSVGITVLIGIVGFFLACGVLFGVRWWILRRRFQRAEVAEQQADWEQKKQIGDTGPDGDTLHPKKWEEGKKKGLFYAESSTGSDWTRGEQAWALEEHGHSMGQKKEDEDARAKTNSRSRSPTGSFVSDTGHMRREADQPIHPDVDGWGAESRGLHVRTTSEFGTGGIVAIPLLDEGESSPWSSDAGTPLAHDRVPSRASVSFFDELGMAGVGARSSVASSGRRMSRPRGARAPSGGSSSSRNSRTWSADVGQLSEQADNPVPLESEQG